MPGDLYPGDEVFPSDDLFPGEGVEEGPPRSFPVDRPTYLILSPHAPAVTLAPHEPKVILDG